MTTNSMTVKLGREELLSVMAVIGLRGMPGLGLDYFADQTPAEIQQTISAGFNSLRARDLLQESTSPEGKTVMAVDETLLASVGVCATAPRVLLINRVPLGGPFIPWYVHIAPHLTVIHSSPESGLDVLFISVSADDVVAEIANFLALAETSAAGPVFSLGSDVYEAAVNAVQAGKPQEAEQSLGQAGLDADAIRRLIQTIMQPAANTTFAYCELKGEGENRKLEPVEILSLLQSAEQIWLMRNPDPAVLQLQPAARSDVLAILEQWLSK